MENSLKSFWNWMIKKGYSCYWIDEAHLSNSKSQMLIGYMIEYCFNANINIKIEKGFLEDDYISNIYDYLKARIELFNNGK